jgi:hypothetical protein
MTEIGLILNLAAAAGARLYRVLFRFYRSSIATSKLFRIGPSFIMFIPIIKNLVLLTFGGRGPK